MVTYRRVENLKVDIESWSAVFDVSGLRRERRALVRRLARAGVSTSSTSTGRSSPS